MNIKQLNILLADDDRDDCHFFKHALEELPLTVHLTTVFDGEQLMNYLSENTQPLPEVLFLDLNMPRKNGFECLSEIKLNQQIKHLPVIIFTTSLEQEVVNLLHKNGAHYFIRKPAEFSQFKKIIHHTLITLIVPKKISQPAREDFVLTLPNKLVV